MGYARGYKGVLQVQDPADATNWLDIAGQDNATLDESSETEDVTSKPPLGSTAAAYKEEEATTKNFALSATGKTDFGDAGFQAWYAAGREQRAINCRFVMGDSVANAGKYLGYTFPAIPSFSQDFPVTGVVSYNVSHLLQGTPVYADDME